MEEQNMRDMLIKLMSNETFEGRIGKIKTPDEMKELCFAYGLEASDELLAEIVSAVGQSESADDENEMQDEELEDIAGGKKTYYWFGKNDACTWYATSNGTHKSDAKACYKYAVHKRTCPFCRTAQIGCARNLPYGKRF